MDYSQNLKVSQKTSHEAIQHMAEHNVLMVPQNYEIWFAYFADQNQELKSALDALMADPSFQFTQDVSNEIYKRYFDADAKITDAYWDMSDQMQMQMSTLMDSLEETLKHTADYSATLSHTTGSLDDVSSPAHLKTLVENVVKATKEMEDRNQNLESQLENSTQQIQSLQNNLEDIRQEAITDALTGLPNRKALDENLRSSIENAAQSGKDLCMLFVDIDHFKKFNDTWGHQTGDTVLKFVAHCLKKNIKGKDMPARFGGEEFSILLPETSLEDAVILANNIRENIAAKKLQRKSTGEDMGHITVSIGAAHYRTGESPNSLLERADTCLYAAKKAGRNQVVTEEVPDLATLSGLKKSA